MDRQARLDRQNEVQALIEREKPRLLAIPGVKTVGVGLKVTGEEMSSEIVLRVGVEKKRPLSDLPADELIPEEIDGIPTDVYEWLPGTLIADTGRYRPLMGGIQIGNGTGSLGTLGCLARRNAEDDVVMLSNQHVMFAGKDAGATGIEIAQPGFSCCCCCRSGKIGDVVASAGATGGTADCAIATIVADIDAEQEVTEIGGITGTDTAVVGDAVRKRGRTTGLTTGTISDLGVSFSVDGSNTFSDTIMITPDSDHPRFVDSGDSGSVVVNEDNRVVGLIFAKSSDDVRGAANPIAAVEAALNITVHAQPNASAGQPPVLRMPPPGSDGLVRRRDWEAMFWAELDGDEPVARMIGRNWSEVWDLIQTNREVGLRWQRGQGPAFTAAFERTTRVTSYRVPEEIDGVSFTHLLLSMAAAFDRHGSAQLQAAVRGAAIRWIPQLQGCRTADELWLEYQRIKQAARTARRDTG